MAIANKDLPSFVRRCYEAWKKANIRNREAEHERLRFYAGGEMQWHSAEVTKRKAQNRPIVTINKCKPAVDQIEGDIRLNPPGPQSKPVGDHGPDHADADIIDGLIREVEYRSNAKTAYSTAGKYVAASGYGVLELGTEFVSENSFSQRLVILSVEDPATVFFDPNSRMANREDAMWAGKLKMYATKEEYIAAFGSNHRVLKDRSMQSAMGWIQEAMGLGTTLVEINEWTGSGKGPFYVCEFYMVETRRVKLRLYDDLVARFEDEEVPKGVQPKEGEEYTRIVLKRTITKYIVDALEKLDETEWFGDLIPLFPVLGPEVYIEGKLHRLSLIAGALDSQRALNYVATTATELAGALPKAPFIGFEGQFDDERWKSANSEMWAYLEVKPVFATNELGEQQLLPAPQRNMWEAPIQWLIALGAWFSDSIKAVTAIYDPSLGQQKGDQSGKAIQQLRSESSVGNYSYADNLHRAIGIMYKQMVCIFPKILDGPRVALIVKSDNTHEMVRINQDFSASGGIDKATGKKGVANNICLGQYSTRVTVGPSADDRSDMTAAILTDFFKAVPQTLAAPGVAAQYLRIVGKGDPQVEALADLLAPDTDTDATPQQLNAKLAQAQQQVKALTQVLQKAQMAIQAQLPKIEADKFNKMIDSLTKIRVAEITASKDADRANADRDADTFEHITGMAHETAMQAVEHEHAQGMQDSQQAAAAQSQTQAEQAAAAQQEEEPGGATQ